MDLHHARDPFSFTGCTPLSPSVIRDAIDVAFNVRRSSMAGRELVGDYFERIARHQLRQTAAATTSKKSHREIGLRLRVRPKQELKVGVSLGCMVSA